MYLLAGMALWSCSSPAKNTMQLFQQVLSEEQQKFGEAFKQKKVLMVIPRTGCSSCIGLADRFFKDQQYDPELFQFIFTRVSAVKTLKMRLGADLISSPNAYIDRDARFSVPNLDSIYPMVIYLEDGQVTGLEYLDPQNQGLLRDLHVISAN